MLGPVLPRVVELEIRCLWCRETLGGLGRIGHPVDSVSWQHTGVVWLANHRLANVAQWREVFYTLTHGGHDPGRLRGRYAQRPCH